MAISTAIDLSAVARGLGVKTTYKDLRGGNIAFLPQRIALVGQGSTTSTYSTSKAQYTKAFDVGAVYGTGSPLHLAAKQLLPENGDGIGTIPLTVYPLDDAATSQASTGSITPSGPATAADTYVVRVNNIDSLPVTVKSGDTAAAIVDAIVDSINNSSNMPVAATDGTTKADIASKWKGVSANDIKISIVGSTGGGISYTIGQPTSGSTNPDVDTALNQIGNVWETLVINCLDIADTATLEKYSTFGEGRWGALVRKPLVVFTGNVNKTVALATAVSKTRKTDRVNAQLVSPDSNDLPFVVAARQVARIAVLANNTPPHDYGSQQATGLVPGPDGSQWLHADRDMAVKAGSSTIEVKDGVVNLSDTVTFYNPTSEPIPAYRYVVDQVKLANIIYNIDLIFSNSEWDGAPLIPDNEATTERTAKKPKMAVAAVAGMIDQLGLNAIISGTKKAKESIRAGINESNPKRLDLRFTLQLSGNANIISIDLDFGFYFGSSTVIS